jgi:hypothetical protein
MKKLKIALACLTVAVASAAPASALAGPPEHCDGEFGDPCKPFFILCTRIEESTKGKVTCGD